MRRRRLLLPLAVLSALGLVAILGLLHQRRQRAAGDTRTVLFTREKYERIKGGMTRTEVHAILGEPIVWRGGIGHGGQLSGPNFAKAPFREQWADDQAEIVVTFDGDWRVMGKGFSPSHAGS